MWTVHAAIGTAVNGAMGVSTAALVAIASIALVGGGIGIANIMLASVHERTCEISLRRAVGASRTAILAQFLAESAVLSVGGGVLGVLFAALVGGLAAAAKPDFPIHLSAPIVTIALGFSALVGVVAGVAPAFPAAGLLWKTNAPGA
jgi:putative ABC transport system permease protein